MITHNIFAIDIRAEGNSTIKFGGWDPINVQKDTSKYSKGMRMFKTIDLANWNLRATNFYLGYDEFEQAGSARVVNLNPHLPYIYIPDDDWRIISERL